jgi:hypothetical protein
VEDRPRVDVETFMSFENLQFRPYREGDEASILELLNEQGSIRCTLDEWAWLHPYEEPGRSIVVGEEAGEVTAVCGGARLQVEINGREWPAIEIRHLVAETDEVAGKAVDCLVKVFGTDGRCALVVSSHFPDIAHIPGFVSRSDRCSQAFVRERFVPASRIHLRYRAEPARDWEPRLDELWRRTRGSYPNAAVRDAEYALRRFAGHPTVRHHRFIVCPRFSSHAVAFGVLAGERSRCRWVDLVWDHDHPGALELLANLSGRLAGQLGANHEEVWMVGDAEGLALLAKRGFAGDDSLPVPIVSARSIAPDVDVSAFVEGAYLTLADVGRRI